MEPIVQQLEDVVCALRIQHPGVVGVTIWWTRIDPPDLAVLARATRELLGASSIGVSFDHELSSQVAGGNSKPLKELCDAVAEARKDKRLALVLRRYNSAYERQESTDSLIDLWIAFEALLIPENDNAELSYRASLRLARVAEDHRDARAVALDTAKASYRVRSKIVHGTAVPVSEMKKTLVATRQLARKALYRWMLDRPIDGVKSVDEELLA
jgi:hypothetical protein